MEESSPRRRQTRSGLARTSPTPGLGTVKRPSASSSTSSRTSSPRSNQQSSSPRVVASTNKEGSSRRGQRESPPASFARSALVQARSDHAHDHIRPRNPALNIVSETRSRTAGQVQPAHDRSATLWDKACASLREKHSKHLLVLDTTFERFEKKGIAASIPEKIGRLVEQRQDGISSKDKVSADFLRRTLSRIASFMTTMRPAALGLPQLLRLSGVDSLGIAPVILGGIYTLVEILQNDRRETLTAMPALIDIAETIAVWKCIETRQIRKNHDQTLIDLYSNLSANIIRLYELAIGLLGTMIAHFDRTRIYQLLGALLPAHEEWTELRSRVKAQEEVCKRIKDQVAIIKERQEFDSKILNAISSHQNVFSYEKLLERTGVDNRYQNACQWIIELPRFNQWLTHPKRTVLWFNGNAGTGKTTVMLRIIRELRQYADLSEKRFAFFFFEKAGAVSESRLNVETCLRSLVRQLSWKGLDSGIEPATERKYDEIKMQRRPDASLSAGECLSLLKQLTSAKETYLLIDGVDECEDPTGLLRGLKQLSLHNNSNNQVSQPLRLLLSGRTELPISDLFTDCLKVTPTSEHILSDQTFFVDTEIDYLAEKHDGALFFSNPIYPAHLKRILKAKGQGVFIWMKIQIEKFTKTGFFRTEDEIKAQLRLLEDRVGVPELDREYDALLSRLTESGNSRNRAISMLKLIFCSTEPLRPEMLAEAVNSRERGMGATKMTAEGVCRLLVGFVSGDFRTGFGEPQIISTPTYLYFSHGSVVEYLRGSSLGFTDPAQHSEMAESCFASISGAASRMGFHGQNFHHYVSRRRPEQESTSLDFSEFLGYSCLMWPYHCQQALRGDAQCTFVEKAGAFVCSNKWVVYTFFFDEYKDIWVGGDWQAPVRSMGHPASTFDPTFFIICFGLTPLLRLPQIKESFDLRKLIQTATRFSLGPNAPDANPLDSLIQSKWVELDRYDGRELLDIAIQFGSLVLARRVLARGRANPEVHLKYLRHGTLLSQAANFYQLREGKPNDLEMVKLLLANGASLYSSDPLGSLAIHKAPGIYVLLIERARRLEQKGLRGSIQRLLRARNMNHCTPVENIENLADELTMHVPGLGGRPRYEVENSLKRELQLATERDGEVLYDFGWPDAKSFQPRFHKTRNRLQMTLFESEANRALYKAWWGKRRWCLQQRYEAMERELAGPDATMLPPRRVERLKN